MGRRVGSRIGCSLLMLFALLALPAPAPAQADAAALRVLDDALAAYNASDEKAWLAVLHFPHVRITSGKLEVFPDPKSYLPGLNLAQHGWDYAKWTERRVLRSEVSQVVVEARFTRFAANGSPVDSFEALYVICLRKGRWGIIARLS